MTKPRTLARVPFPRETLPDLLWPAQDLAVCLAVLVVHASLSRSSSEASWRGIAAVSTTLAAFSLSKSDGDRRIAGSPVWRLVGIAVRWAGSSVLAYLLGVGGGDSTWLLMVCGGTLFVYRELELLLYRAWGTYFRTPKAAAVLGATKTGVALKNWLQAGGSGYRLVGVYDDRIESRRESIAVEGSFSQAVEDARAGSFDIVFVCLPLRAHERTRGIIAAMDHSAVEIRHVAEDSAFRVLSGTIRERFDGLSVVRPAEAMTNADRFTKRLFDVTVGLVLLSLALPALLVLGLLVKATSRGPVYFIQTRYAPNGSKVRVPKLRTMTVLDESQIIRQSHELDVRITRLGRFLRKTGLDHLPLLFSVVSGELSLVGPQATPITMPDLYSRRLGGHLSLQQIKPGLTGWAKIHGYTRTDDVRAIEERVRFDLEYVDNWSIWLDIQILFTTLLGRRPRNERLRS